MRLLVLILAMALSVALALWSRQPLAPLSEGWFKAGANTADYEVGLDLVTQLSGRGAKTIRYPGSGDTGQHSVAMITQTILADNYRGRQVRFAAQVKTEDVEGWSGLWMRIDGPEQEILALDNMQARPLRGDADWLEYPVILNVPKEAVVISFGLLQAGNGQTWMDQLSFRIVENQQPTSDGSPEDSDYSFRTEPTL
ncbi:hypothetical protein [Permianibacter aggregans]|uniref:Uncharacterized protein n=1 Tax=Permianibacter aggregans TaxID=1510150 RepID=A0A4R6UPD2_9GAMM|nr:hypothetical protein [Permianibacter aggregans]QGX40126.1 hypothetical protein E2H98_10770 [Permianibacter aggregans]TDQ49060.1 hypothetical protein EV696_10534 [Permianibacter aggregans]